MTVKCCITTLEESTLKSIPTNKFKGGGRVCRLADLQPMYELQNISSVEHRSYCLILWIWTRLVFHSIWNLTINSLTGCGFQI